MSRLTQSLKARFLRQAWPDPDTDLLIKASLLPPDEARDCWRNWKAQNNIDDCTWPQFKILSRFSGRLPDIDPDCREIPRLHGMAKALWTKSQMQLNRSARALDVLQEAGLDVYLMKSAAFEALGMTKVTRRVTSDIDLMVKRRDLRQALTCLLEAGWGKDDTLDQALERCRYHPGINLTRGGEATNDLSDVDVHHQPVHLPFLSDAMMQSLWEKSETAVFRGRKVRVPAAEELLVFTAMQGVRRFIPSHLSSGMWPFDLVEIISSKRLDWNRVLDVAGQCEGLLALQGCLAYLQEELDTCLPSGLMPELASRRVPVSQSVVFYAQAPTHGPLRLLHLPLRELALMNRHKAFCRQGWVASQTW